MKLYFAKNHSTADWETLLILREVERSWCIWNVCMWRCTKCYVLFVIWYLIYHIFSPSYGKWSMIWISNTEKSYSHLFMNQYIGNHNSAYTEDIRINDLDKKNTVTTPFITLSIQHQLQIRVDTHRSELPKKLRYIPHKICTKLCCDLWYFCYGS